MGIACRVRLRGFGAAGTAVLFPAALAAGADADGGQRIRFRPDRPFDEAELLALPEIRGVQRRGDQVR